MKKVAILANYVDEFHIASPKIDSYKKLTEVFRENDIELRRVSIHSFDDKKGTFSDYVDINASGVFQIFYEEYKPDYIWNRSRGGYFHFYTLLQNAGYKVFPTLNTAQLASDKYEMSLFFRKHHPKTVLLQNFLSDKYIQSSFGRSVVLKPIRANSGKGIQFLDKGELINNLGKYEGLTELYIVQEFKDFSGGIPGLVDGMHDLRLVFIGGDFSHATIRTPKKGGLKSNVGAGGTEKSVLTSQIPKEVFGITDEIIKTLNIEPKNSLFSLDFGYCLSEKKWYILELNLSPGIQVSSETKELFYDTFFINLTRFFNKKLGSNT